VDSNKTRNNRKQESNKNRRAFEEILGNPFTDAPQGIYQTLKFSSSISSVEGTYGEGEGTACSEKPSIVDFRCDVDLIIREVVPDDILRVKFYITYVMEQITSDLSITDKKVRNSLEQKMGKLFRTRGLSPVKRYFTVTRRKRNNVI
jgi:hypothetical protein